MLLAWVISNVRLWAGNPYRLPDQCLPCLTGLLQGLLLAGILGGGQSVDTFKPGGGITAAKAYMTFVLAFVGLTSIIVSSIGLP